MKKLQLLLANAQKDGGKKDEVNSLLLQGQLFTILITPALLRIFITG